MLSPVMGTKFRSGTGKLIHMMRFLRLETYNAIRELSRFMSEPYDKHLEAIYHMMHFKIGMPKRGLLAPKGQWDGSRNYEFEMSAKSDSDSDQDPDNVRCVKEGIFHLKDTPVMYIRTI